MENVTLSERKSFPVRIGDIVLYCEGYKASAMRTLAEASTVSGSNIITNSAPRAMKLTLRGRVIPLGNKMQFVCTAYNMLRSKVLFNIDCRGLSCTGCTLLSFTAEDTGRDFINAEMTLASPNALTIGDEDE